MTAALKNTPDPITTPTTVENAPKNPISFFNFVKIYLLKNIINNDECINKKNYFCHILLCIFNFYSRVHYILFFSI